MKRIFSIFLLTIALGLCSFSGISHWMVGTTFEWTCVGQDSFLISFTAYRDCTGIQLGSATIPIKCATTGVTITTLSIAKPQGIDITPSCASSCTRCQSSGCTFPYGIDKYVYTKLLVLTSAGSCCKINMSYSMCCRSSTITTGAQDEYYYNEAELNRCITPCDNSPKFTNEPHTLLCVGKDVVFNHGVIDRDTNTSGSLIDSISYEWTPPLDTDSSSISYSGLYSYNKPIFFWGFPQNQFPTPRGFKLNMTSGDIFFRSMKNEKTVICIKVKEWRNINGTMTNIGHQTRDIIVTVISCTANFSPVLSGPYYKEVCAGQTVNFNINSHDYDAGDTLEISWNNAIDGASWTTNNGSVKNPTGTLSWTPTEQDAGSIPYSFTVTVKDDACPMYGSSTRAYEILVKPNPEASFSVVDSGCGNYYFNAQKTFGINPNFRWDGTFFHNNFITGDSAHAKIPSAGIFPFSLTVSESGCSTTYPDTLKATDSFLFSIMNNYIKACYADSLLLHVTYFNNKGPVQFNWNTGDSTQSILYPVYSDQMVEVEITDSLGCLATYSIFVDMHNLPQVDLGPDQYWCKADSQQLFVNYKLGSPHLKSIRWYDQSGYLFLNDTISHISIHDSGTWYCVVEDSLNCKGEDTILVFINPFVDAFAENVEICKGDTATFFADSTGSKTNNVLYKWYNIDYGSLVGQKQSIELIPFQTTMYLLKVTEVIGGTSCFDNHFVQITVHDKPSVVFNELPQTCLDDALIHLNNFINSAPQLKLTWTSPGPGLLPDYPGDKFHPFKAGTGKHTVVLTVVDTVTACFISDSNFVTIHPLPTPDAGEDADICAANGMFLLDGKPDSPTATWRSVLGIGLTDTNGVYFFDPNATGVSDGTSYPLAYHYTDSNGCENEDTLHISVNKITADFESDLRDGMSPLTVNFTDKSDPQKLTLSQWFWIFGDSSTSMLANPSHTFFDTGRFSIGLWVSDGNNCMDSITKTNYIQVSPHIGILEQPHSVLHVYPNPANNELIIKFTNSDEFILSVSLMNIEGKLLKHYMDNGRSELHLTDINLPTGLYYLKINSSKGSSYYRKIMIN